MLRDPRCVEVVPVCHESGCRSYVVIAPETREGAVIDPLLDHLSETIGILEGRRATLRYVFDTHSHGDHLSGAAALHGRLGGEVVMHPLATSEVATLRADDGALLAFGEHGLRVHHAPGNTLDAIVVEARGALFTGDTLLIGTVGLRDGPASDPDDWLGTRQRVFGDRPDDTVIHPGHDDMGRTTTTLGAERAGNLWLREEDRDKFLAMWASDDRRLRKDAARVLEANRQGLQRIPHDLAAAEGLTAPAEVAEADAAISRGKPKPPPAPTSGGPYGLLVVGGALAAAGTILGWMFDPAFHGLSLVAALVLLGAGLPGLERSRRRPKQDLGLFYEGPSAHRITD